MKKLILLLCVSFLFTAVKAQTNFSGTWKLNQEASELQKQYSMAPKSLEINQTEQEFKVDKRASFQGNDFTISDIYTLDGEESINDGWMDTQKKSTAVWSDDQTALKITTKIPMQDGGEMTVVEDYYFENDKMVINAKANSSFGEFSEKMVFDKK